MTKVEEIESAISSLPKDEYAQLRQWFIESDWQKWDQQIEADAASGKLDFLLQEVEDAKKHNHLRDL